MKCLVELKCDKGFSKCCFGCKNYDKKMCEDYKCYTKCDDLKKYEKGLNK